MPKLRKEVEDKILELIDAGYSNAEISEKMDVNRKTVANRRKKHHKRKQEQEKPETEKEKPIHQEQETPTLDPQKYTRAHTDEDSLSELAMIRLGQIHSLLGANSLEEMLETVYADYLVVDKLWLEYKEFTDVTKTFAWVIAEEQGYAADLKHDLDVSDKGFQEDQKLIEDLKAEAEEQYEEGYQKGKNDHALLFPCRRCSEPGIILPGTEIHRLVVDFLVESGIVHNDCLPRYERIYVP